MPVAATTSAAAAGSSGECRGMGEPSQLSPVHAQREVNVIEKWS